MPGTPATLAEAMAYTTCGGGKRFRGALAMGACAAVGGKAEASLPVACALEMVHAFSLVHDDLPCMD
ncbi:MAG: polyprenyl synthetase family protein, partial [Firmicutes bacterium]|nr:polyprenyl synthetase family protein [Bacillota bacterium]